MTNRLALALAVAAGYALGRTKKAKMAIGVGGLVLGKRLKLSPQQLTGLLSEQLKANPQLAEIRDQLRGDLRGVGKAATNALVTRQLDSLADNLHDRTLGVRDRIDTGQSSGGLTDADDEDDKPGDDAYEARGEEERDDRRERRPVKKAASPARKAGKTASASAASAAKKTASGRADGDGGKRPSGPSKKTPAKSAAKTARSAKKSTSSARSAKKAAGGGGRG